MIPNWPTLELADPYSHSAALLKRLPESHTPNEKANLLSSLALLNRANNEFFQAADVVLQEREKQLAQKTHDAITTAPFLGAVDKMLRALHGFFDITNLVVLGIHPGAVPKSSPKIFNHEWLKGVDKTVQDTLWQGIKPIAEDVGRIVNGLKHEGWQLQPLIFNSTELHLGYYVQGVSHGTGLGPDPSIHPGGTAFSLARDFRLRLYQWAIADQVLADTLQAVLIRHNISLAPDGGPAGNAELIGRVLRAAAELPRLVFPDEARKNFPDLEDLGSRKPRVRLEVKPRSGRPLHRGQYQFIANGDDATKHGIVPDLGALKPNEWNPTATM